MDRTLLPNATQFPNVLTDQVMPLVTGNEWKVIHYGVRYALGYRSTDTLTVAQIAHGRAAEDGTWIDRGTGLSEAEAKACLAFLCDEVHLFLREDRPRKPHGYRLNTDFSSINLHALEQRQGAGSGPTPNAPAAPSAPSPAAALPVAPPSVLLPTLFVESPTSDVRLGVSDRSVIEQMQVALSSDEERTFAHLVALAQDKNIGPLDHIAWALYTLWRTYGFRRLQNAFQLPGVATLDEVSKSCLVGVVTEMLEAERFGPITQTIRDKVVTMADEWPVLDDWQEAIRSAVLYNSHRLATVEKNLKRMLPGSAPEPPGVKDHAGPTAPAQNRKRAARRQSEWSSDELRAGREADEGQEWPKPLD